MAAETENNARKRAYTARIYTAAVMKALRDRFALRVNLADHIVSSVELISTAKGCQYLFISVTERVDADVIDALSPALEVIATLSSGTDHIDIDHARRRGIAVVTTPDVLSPACAELAWLLILAATRRGHEADAMVRSGDWPGWSPTQLLGRGLTGRRLGILGMGRIGREIGARSRGFGVELHYHNRRRLESTLEAGAIYHADPDDLVAQSDILCLCAPATADLDGFLDRDRIERLPVDPIVINVSRGDLIDDDALIEALQRRRVFAAGLDVYRGEPAIDRRYAALPNVFLSPHIGSATVETRDAMGFALLDGIDAFEAGRQVPNLLFEATPA